MRKIIAIICILIMSCLIFTGCGTKENSRFVIIDSDVETEDRITSTLYADKQTNVVYLFTENGSYGQTMTVLLNPDGTPILYDFEKEKIIEKDSK